MSPSGQLYNARRFCGKFHCLLTKSPRLPQSVQISQEWAQIFSFQKPSMDLPYSTPTCVPKELPTGYQGPCVLVTGGNGFLAYHIVETLITEGKNVIISARSVEKAREVVEFFHARHHVPIGYFVTPDTCMTTAFNDVFTKFPNITAVIHTCAPFHYDESDNDLNFTRLYYEPIVIGTKNLLSTIRNRGENVKVVVLTSTIEAAVNFTKPDVKEYNEESWTCLSWDQRLIAGRDLHKAYLTAKEDSEFGSWNTFQYHLLRLQFTFNSILMPMAIGPHLNHSKVNPFEDHINTSSKLVWRIANSRVFEEDEEIMSNTILPCLDVRDLAEIHVVALGDDIKKQRFLPFFQDWFCALSVNLVVEEKFPSLSGRLYPVDPIQQTKLMLGIPRISNDQTRQLLEPHKDSYRSVRQLIEETLTQFIEQDPFEMEITRIFYTDPVKEPYDFEGLLNLPDPDFEQLLEFAMPELDDVATELILEEIDRFFESI